MGVIRRQGLKKSIVLYFGVLIGIFSTLYIYPLAEDVYGLAQFLLSMAGILAPFLSFGVNSLAIRFFPKFQDKGTGHHGFLGLLLLLASSSFILFGAILYFIRHSFYDLLHAVGMDVQIFSQNLLETGILAWLILSNSIVTSYISNFKRITIPGIFNSIFLKIGLPILIILYYYQVVHIPEFKIGFILLFALILISLLLYTHRLGELHLVPDFSFLSRKIMKKMAEYSAYGVLANIGSIIAFRIDAIMTASLLGFSSTGIYSIADNIAGVIATPFKSINEISAPVFAQQMNDGELGKVAKLYKSSSITLLIIGCGLLIVIYVSIESIFSLSSQYDVLIQGQKVVLFLGMTKVLDMTTGLNNFIIAYSKHYRWGLVWILLLSVLNVGFNLTLIPKYGIVGAALSTMLSMILYNAIKFIFVWVKFDMQPFTWNHLWVFLTGGLAYLVGSAMPETGYHLLDIVLKSGMTISIFGAVILYFNFSQDITNFIQLIIYRISQFFRTR